MNAEEQRRVNRRGGEGRLGGVRRMKGEVGRDRSGIEKKMTK